MTNPSRFGDIGVVALVPEPWGDRWQLRHQILTRLAKYFRVVWVSPTHDWRNSVSAWRTRRQWARSSHPDLPEGFQIYIPQFWLPQCSRFDVLARASLRRRLQEARKLLGKGCRTTALSVWNPEFATAPDLEPFDVCSYHVDDEYSFSKSEKSVSDVEKQLLRRVDQVFVSSPALFETRGHFNPNTALIPNGVNYASFSTPVECPDDLAAIPRPRVGFTGYLTRHLDWVLLERLADRHPNCSFVFVGAQKERPEVAAAIRELSRRKNVWFLGAKPSWEMAKYPQHFDVCMMPYETNAFTGYIYPLKLHEYLASGVPTVGAKIRSLRDFADVVLLAGSTDEWSCALKTALTSNAASLTSRLVRQAVARKHDWERLTLQMARLIATRLRREDVLACMDEMTVIDTQATPAEVIGEAKVS